MRIKALIFMISTLCFSVSQAMAGSVETVHISPGSDSFNEYVSSSDGLIVVGNFYDITVGTLRGFIFSDGVKTNLGSLDGSFSRAIGISSDGTTVVGRSTAGVGEFHAFRWTGGVMEDLGTLGGTVSEAGFVSSDGSVVAGDSFIAGDAFSHAFRWEGGSMTDLGTLGGNESFVRAMSADGTVIAGGSFTALGQNHAFRWEGGIMTDLGTLGGPSSQVTHMSTDGSVIAGYSENASAEYRGFHWESGVMTDIGTLGGSLVDIRGLSSDGSVIAGNSQNASGDNRSYRWEGGVMTDLGTLGGNEAEVDLLSKDGSTVFGTSQRGDNSNAAYQWRSGVMTDLGAPSEQVEVRFASVDGNVAVGYCDCFSNNNSLFRWEDGEFLNVYETLTDPGDWESFESALSLSDDGNYIIGQGINGGRQGAFLYSFRDAAVTTPEEVAQSLQSSAAAVSGQTRSVMGSHLGQSLHIARNALDVYFQPSSIGRRTYTAPSSPTEVEPAAGDPSHWSSDVPDERRLAIYGIGSLGLGHGNNDLDNRDVGGNTGLLYKVSDHIIVGAGIVGAVNSLETQYDGENRINAKGGTLIAAYAPPEGLNLFATATVANIDVDVDRHYLNGGATVASSGKTEGTGTGVLARAGYVIPLNETTSVMPYFEGEATHTRLSAYTETGGTFPATVDAQSGNSVVTRIGGEISHAVSEEVTIRSRAALVHSYGDSDDVHATAATLSFDLPSNSNDRNWIEAGVSAGWRMSDNATISADFGGRSGESDAPALNSAVALTIAF